MWRYLREFLSDPRVIELPRVDLVSDPLRAGADHAAAEIRRQLRRDLEPRHATNPRCRTFTRAQAEKLAAALGRPAGRRSSNGACATATRRSRARSQRLTEQGCDRIVTLPALSAIFGDDDGDRQRQVLPRADEDAPAAGGAHACRPTTTSRSISRRWPARSRQHLARLDFEPEVVARLLSRHSESLFREGRPLSLPLPEDDAAAARTARLGRQEADHHLPVALRRAGMAAALHRQDGREAGARKA